MKAIDEPAGVTDAIADIERRRVEATAVGGMALACSAALHRLREILDHEAEALRLRGPASAHQVNVEAVSAEIVRVKRLSVPKYPARKTTGGADARGSDANAGHWRQSTKEV